MSKDASTPRFFLIRHGATEWSKSGRYTGISDIPLLPEGEASVRQTASVVFGKGKLIDPKKLARVYVSPRIRAKRTWELLLESLGHDGHAELRGAQIIETSKVQEWSYGDYEGLLPKELKALRWEQGFDREKKWNIWDHGTEGRGSESPDDVSERVDEIIKEVVEIQGTWMERKQKGQLSEIEAAKGCDILVVAHGHILRAVVKRWLGFEMGSKVDLMLEPGGVCGLSYAHENVEERAVLVGMSFPQP